YRKDLVPTPPATWDQMIEQAIALRQQGKPGLVEIQGAQYEGLTVWFNSLVASAGGRILDDNGKLAVDDTSRQAAEVMHRLATSRSAASTSASAPTPGIRMRHSRPRPASATPTTRGTPRSRGASRPPSNRSTAIPPCGSPTRSPTPSWRSSATPAPAP